MDKDFVSTYLRFLKEASDAEINRERARLQALSSTLIDSETKRDLRWMIGKVIEELQARSEVAGLENRRNTRE